MSGVDTSFSSSRVSAMFLREEVVMKVLNFTVIVPVSLILLFRSAPFLLECLPSFITVY